ncbi:MAG: rhodanese-like domain-containing protein [Candidatus Sericytochromatia bacterium]|nr:rhodanese-like domain-containing protein [Candidatus Sericytochromatia bacterium]
MNIQITLRQASLGLLAVAVSVGCQATPSALPSAATEPTPAAAPVTNEPYQRATPKDLRDRQAAGENVVIVDVRSAASYAAEHIEGAVSAPWADIQAGTASLPKDKLLFLYCT